VSEQTSPAYDPKLDAFIWGAKAIAKAIKRSERSTYHLLERRLIDADKIGGTWRSSLRRLLLQPQDAS
jgi:hypothetical protein